jgi:hypothetical protein
MIKSLIIFCIYMPYEKQINPANKT